MSVFKETILIDAPIDSVWSTLADIGSIAVWNPGVKHSIQTSPGEVEKGSTRHCDLGGRNYLDEEVITFQPPHKLTISITKTNMPFRKAHIRFVLEEQHAQTKVIVSPLYELKYGLLGDFMDRLFVQKKYTKGMNGLLEGLKEHVEKELVTQH